MPNLVISTSNDVNSVEAHVGRDSPGIASLFLWSNSCIVANLYSTAPGAQAKFEKIAALFNELANPRPVPSPAPEYSLASDEPDGDVVSSR